MTTQPNRRNVVSAEKAPQDKLEKQIQVFHNDQFVRKLLDAIPSLLAVLNSHRQIIYANHSLIDMLEVDGEAALLGQRPGDVFECVHVFDADDGCGSGELCQTCGALVAIIAGEKRVEECRMTRLHESRIQAHELKVTATPFRYADETFTIFSVEDKSAEHRRLMLERIFFHDIMNSVGSIKVFSELLEMPEHQEKEKIYLRIREAAEQVIGEVEKQRVLSDAEHGRLEVQQEFCSSIDVLQRVAHLYGRHKASALRTVNIAEDAENHYLQTDQSLLMRILGNMVVNALEAVDSGETVTLACRMDNKTVVFSVHNPGEIPMAVRPEIFRRTYSTKGPGRGLGTYSMRLLSAFLEGRVSFESDAELGTIFELRLPENLDL